ncbi:Rtt105p NDAI_0A01590 [Naumovozyma dairenensis CBS 421]|uniref:Uncharacterized protein n=1 Tax=Naumovozyma dairenensis (strain ATCC 10597 / BCRC 20456 / CBS 421 / NBRC 0211 / NRRL Y-12639) TaxID=1071378 RepID=G0W3C9_NAUDC|nr:hypothetical protein NDAI_0A01590 [Naumovozyma dairenensis CBS 421]CCD22317.1 hypothetical protein NDAI_0A01590 [Naumovozyma dairenensis CBS 421]
MFSDDITIIAIENNKWSQPIQTAQRNHCLSILMSDQTNEWQPSSDPPSESRYPFSSPVRKFSHTPERHSNNTNKRDCLTSDSKGKSSIVDDILDRRRNRYTDDNIITSSPTSSTSKSRADKKHEKMNLLRDNQRQEKLVSIRGGLDKMEQFVMEGERLREIESLKQEAEIHAIPTSYIDEFEQESASEDEEENVSDDSDELEDDELIRMLELQEGYEKELEKLMSDLSVA